MKIIYKEVGETPLEALERLRASNIELINQKLSYAGRLDPMAEGLLMITIGDENKNKEEYLNLDKIYEAEILFGVSTDTFDLLGKVVANKSITAIDEKNLSKVMNSFLGEHEWDYAPFSSKTVDGIPLFELARKKLIKILPKRKSTLYSLVNRGMRFVTIEEVKRNTFNKISKVKGDFRQNEILALWDEYFELAREKLYVLSLTLAVSSGFYVRTFVNEVGKKTGTGAVLYSLKRTKIGEHIGTN